MATYTGIVESNAVQAREQTFAGPPQMPTATLQIRMLRAMWRELETELRNDLYGHEGGNPGYRQGWS